MQIWDLVTRLGGQMRITAAGTVVGWDFGAALLCDPSCRPRRLGNLAPRWEFQWGVGRALVVLRKRCADHTVSM
jgi:hypothetical protein